MDQMIGKAIWITAMIGIGVYFFNSHLEKKAGREARQAQEEKIEQATRTALSEMVSWSNAVDNSEEILSRGGNYRFDPILTIELEKQWMLQRPILFIGVIRYF